MNKNLKKMILEELEMFLLLEQEIEISDEMVQKVKDLDSGTRSDQTLAGADDDVIRMVFQIQAALDLTGDNLDGVYGPITHASILKAQGPYKGKS